MSREIIDMRVHEIELVRHTDRERCTSI